MNFISIILIAFALAMDAFAVSLAAGAYFGRTTNRQKFRLSFHFGLFQFLMPIAGWFAGSESVEYIENFDHWIALIILIIIGTRMILDSQMSKKITITKDITRGLSLVQLSFATSIDALALGFSLGVINNEILFPASVIGIIASAMSLTGIKLGEFLAIKFSRIASIAGGAILILIGIKILCEHLQIL